MATRLTTEEVNAQMMRFNAFMQVANFRKIGERYFYMEGHDNQDGRYNGYCYVFRVLSLLANVKGAMYHPTTLDGNSNGRFYNEILKHKAIDVFLSSL